MMMNVVWMRVKLCVSSGAIMKMMNVLVVDCVVVVVRLLLPMVARV